MSLQNQDTLKIKRVPIDSLYLDPSNARIHDTQNLEAITSSLKRFGQAEPLVVQGKTGRVIGGNGRLVAMKKLGWTECEIVELEVDDLTATSLGIALNRTAELAGWDEKTLVYSAQINCPACAQLNGATGSHQGAQVFFPGSRAGLFSK